MRKLLSVLAVVILLSAALINANSISGWFSEGEYSAYGLQQLAKAEGVRYRDYKTFTEATAELPYGVLARFTLGDRKGETVTVNGNREEMERLLKLFSVKVIMRQTVGDTQIIYGYTKRLNGAVTVNGQTVNVQFATSGEKLVVGTPVILGSY